MGDIWAQLVPDLWPDGRGARSGARLCCSGPRIWFRASRGTPHADPARRGFVLQPRHWYQGPCLFQPWLIHVGFVTAMTHPRDCSWLPWFVPPWLISIRVGPGLGFRVWHLSCRIGTRHVPAVTHPRRFVTAVPHPRDFWDCLWLPWLVPPLAWLISIRRQVGPGFRLARSLTFVSLTKRKYDPKHRSCLNYLFRTVFDWFREGLGRFAYIEARGSKGGRRWQRHAVHLNTWTAKFM